MDFRKANLKHYIIQKDRILRLNSFNVTSKRVVYFTVHSLETIRTSSVGNEIYEGVISFMTGK